MAYTLIITEKPAASKKLADALAEGKAIKENMNGVPYYKITRGKKDLVVACAVGHLYGLAEKKKSWDFPVFDIEWQPSHETRKQAAFSKKYLQAIKKLAKEADEFIVATDFDIEGETIGLNVIRYACKQKDSERMKFSTLTKDDLVEAYEKRSKTLDWGQADAGETRHFLDFFNGISYSRALTSAYKTTGGFKVLSIGRVQGPALKIVVDREKEIKAFKPVPYWQIELKGNVNDGDIEAWHIKDKFWDKKEANQVMKNVKGQKKGTVDKVEKKQFKQHPPNPFDLTAMQVEAYRLFKIQPKDTLAIAQELYTAGFISYPRTSSNQLPSKIGYSKILSLLTKQERYGKLCFDLLKKKLKPNNGKKTDPAHPAIYPTGIAPQLDDRAGKIYDLIVRRFMATFGEAAIRETMKINIDINKEIFVAKGTRTVEKGWFVYYGDYVRLEEEELPHVKEGDNVNVKKITLYDKETLPPKRYTPASIIKALEKKGLGTKCLTSNNFVKINSNNQIHNENVAELFDGLYSDCPVQELGMKIAINNNKTCFSFDEFDETRSNFKLVSKRKLDKDEKVYRVEYNDGSFIEVTEEHPFLVYNGDSCRYIPVKNLKKGMKSVTSVKFPEREGDIICTWEAFLKRCSQTSKLYGISDGILEKRKGQNLSQHAFGRKYNLNQSNISIYENTQNIPLYIIKKLNLSKPKNICSVNKNLIIKNIFPLKMSSSLARILANLVGDCSIDSKKIVSENCYDFRYHNTDIDLINKFIKDVKTVFGVDLVVKLAKPKPGHLPKYYTHVPAVIGRIISILFKEVIKKNAAKIYPEFYPEFIGSLFDDEGHSAKSEPKLFISGTNFRLLEDVRQMLLSLDINAIVNRKQFKLYIRGRENLQKFLEKIPITSVYKRQRLIDNLSRFYKFGRTLSSLQKQFLIVSALNSSNNKELTNRELAKILGFKMPKSMHHLSLLIKNGYIKRIVTGISEYPRKKISYRLIRPIEETFFKYIDENVISPDFITKTIRSIKEIDYSGYVYDITNNAEIPNFILSNGVVVHNSTRASIVDTLFQRHYVHGTKSIEATELGINTIGTLAKFVPKILDEKLTRHFEVEMEEIREGKKKKEDVLDEAKEAITKVISDFKKHEKEVGESLKKAHWEAKDKMATLGNCPNCKDGVLMMRKGKYGSFCACNKYPKCKTTFSLPNNAIIKPSKNVCETCNMPMVLAIKRKKKPMEFCLNRDCKSKHVEGEAGKLAKDIAKGKVEKKCPKCKEGNIVLRKSIYGSFLGCSGYPKCKYTEKLENNKKE